MKTWPDKFVQCVITSPPYWGLRDYGTADWIGGDENCDHNPQKSDGGERNDRSLPLGRGGLYREVCSKCGAKRIDQQLGLEKTPEEYIEKMVAGFREIKRILRKDGTVWLNLGDSYATSGSAVHYDQGKEFKKRGEEKGYALGSNWANYGTRMGSAGKTAISGLKPKDLCGIPWRVALALQADGWYLRSDVIWAKPNPMPESVTDRPTKSHEYIFLLTKADRYFYDADAVREKTGNESSFEEYESAYGSNEGADSNRYGEGYKKHSIALTHPSGRNLRTVWTIATQPCSFAHFATFPDELVNKCILAGTAETACGVCGAPYIRVTETPDWYKNLDGHKMPSGTLSEGVNAGFGAKKDSVTKPVTTLGFKPSCKHNDNTGRCIVFDPFAGTATSCYRAKEMGRDFIGIELSQKYVDYANQKLAQEVLL